MGTLSNDDQERLRNLLQEAVIKCSERCLYQSAKWAAELLNSLPAPELASPTDTEVGSPMSDELSQRPHQTSVISRNEDAREAKLEAAELQKYLMAKIFFDCREYDRCASVFLPITLPKGELSLNEAASGNSGNGDKKPKEKASGSSSAALMSSGFPHLSQKALFLALYAKYMAGEKRRDEEAEQILGPSDNGSVINRELVGISQALEARFEMQHSRNETGQGWLEYLYGFVLAKGKNEREARSWLVKSLNLYSFNWGAWQELASLIESIEELQAALIHVPKNIMSFIFNVFANQELHHGGDDIMSALKSLKLVFPESSFLRSQKALLYYHDKDFDRAERRFSKLLRTDPLRLEDTDTYSNILYVMEKRAKLAYLAQLTSSIDKFRPETCCVVGNYHAVKSEHEKAVTFFRRALTLDRNFSSAWTLMGHEYVEMKNTQTAIECYRRAVDTNRRDFRAWYGLGQTYEILDMYLYSLFYFKRAAALAPMDPKMWNAVASVYTRINRPLEAIKAYKRCLLVGSPSESGSSFGSNSQRHYASGVRAMDPDVLHSIAELYLQLGNFTEAEAYMELALAQEDGMAEDDSAFGASVNTSMATGSGFQGKGVTPTTSKARLWLARYSKEKGMKGDGDALRRALILANELCQDGYEVEEAKSLIKEIRNVISATDARVAPETPST